MKKILIVSDGAIGNHFIEGVIGTHTTENVYYVISPKDTDGYSGYNPSRFKFFNFDPTSYYKISNILKTDFTQAILAMENQTELRQTISNIRALKPNIRIIALDLWNSKSQDDGVEWINMRQILSLNLIDRLPNIPVLAQNIGLGNGEIMEVLVPFGSSFVYRHIGSIEQNNWKIAAIYRNRQLIIPSDQKMIQPNDILVLIGEPSVLKSVYRAIKRELGQFPAPFGSKLYLYIDMAHEKAHSISELVRRSVYIQRKLKKPLLIKIVNPSSVEILRMIKSYATKGVEIEILYKISMDDDFILNDIKKHHIGLFIVSQSMFARTSIREKLYEGNVPVLKLANRSFSQLQQALVILGDDNHVEHISTTVFDVASQLGFNLELIDYTIEERENITQSIEHFSNLSTIFSKSITVVKTEDNPIRFLREYDNFLQCLPFTRKMFQSPLKRLFATDPEILYMKLDNYHQLFIPTQI
ncbi:MAG: TrkA C-terminal domain-containing protein [Sulfuricurvum sp.]|uniref:COG3400 family protein n=1 Tax=Sulfuricurvum sp. TaxID=2025608 RepID=UPI00261C3419|nr:TrkA C-terminal domain-containing protein [Sulfuricurvum sp.]MDD2830276.1 TrkA C-terminal domain-containing protein [Sulfuricurvum sp.]MDD4949479.1 TrkA C-terminal domain-containing protein [Sulfuricurvum sp.]